MHFQNDEITSCGLVDGGIVTRECFVFLSSLFPFFYNGRTLQMTKEQGESIIHRIWKNLMSKKEAEKAANTQKKMT